MEAVSSRRFVGVVAAALLVMATGCGKVAEKASEKVVEKALEQGAGGDVDLDLDLDDGSFSVESDEGSLIVGQSMPGSWPDDIGLPSGFEVASGIERSQGREKVVSVGGSVAGSAEAIVGFFSDELSGWNEKHRSQSSYGGRTSWSLMLENGDRMVQLNIAEAEDGTTDVQISHVEGGGS